MHIQVTVVYSSFEFSPFLAMWHIYLSLEFMCTWILVLASTTHQKNTKQSFPSCLKLCLTLEVYCHASEMQSTRKCMNALCACNISNGVVQVNARHTSTSQVHSAVHTTRVRLHIQHTFDDMSKDRARRLVTLKKRKQREKDSSGIKRLRTESPHKRYILLSKPALCLLTEKHLLYR